MPAMEGATGAFTTGLRDLRDGYRISRGDAFLAAQLRYVVLTGFSNALLLVGSVPWIDEVLHRPAATWGALISVLGGTGIMTSLILTATASRIDTHRLLLVATCAPTLAAVVYAGWTPLAAVVGAFALFGAAHVACAVASEAITQRRVTSEVIGRVHSLPKAMFQLAMFAGTIVGGAIPHATSPAWSMRLLALALVGEAVVGAALVGAARTPPASALDATDRDLAVSG